MRVQGLVFVGTRTTRPTAMARFATQVLGLEARSADGSDAVFFDLPDGSDVRGPDGRLYELVQRVG